MIAMTKTERKPRETDPQDASRDLKRTPGQGPEADLTRRAFLANLRHELRTPLNAIIGYSEMLIEDAQDLNEEYDAASLASDLEKVHAAGNQLLTLVNKTLDPAVVETDQLEHDLVAFGAQLRHALRTPLNAVIGYSEMLLEDARKLGLENFNPDLLKIDTAARRFLALINDIVNYSNIQAGEMDADIENLSASSGTASMIQNVVSTIRSPAEDAASTEAAERGSLLVVDDKETNRDLLARHLERQGHTVALAENGRQALEIIKKHKFDLVLLDILMPEMNGYEVLQRLKRDENWRDIPVIMISALEKMDSVVRCIEMGAEDYLPKPFDPVLLRARIGACLEKKRLRDEAKALLQRLEGELQAARNLQLSMVPQEFPPPTPQHPVMIHAFMEPAREVGGDLYDFFYLGDNNFCFLIGDVSDKGAAAGMFMAMTCSLMRLAPKQWYRATGEVPEPDQILATVNVELCDNNPDMNFVTLLLALFNLRTGELRIANAGHPAPYILRHGQQVETIDTHRSLPLGIRPNETYRTESLKLSSGEGLFLYTDGITDATNASDDFYSEIRLENDLYKLCDIAPADVINTVLHKVNTFAGDSPQFDDMTMLAVRWQIM
jgi:serine phosphatase RsbU (regulator of sigma subunit)/signal transduction histidine kinase